MKKDKLKKYCLFIQKFKEVIGSVTTITILMIGCIGFLGFVGIEFMLWLLEVIFATVKFILCYLLNRPCSWKKSYLGIRIIFTWVLNHVSFAELSPTQFYRRRHGIEVYMRTLVAKQNQRKERIMKHFHHDKAKRETKQ